MMGKEIDKSYLDLINILQIITGNNIRRNIAEKAHIRAIRNTVVLDCLNPAERKILFLDFNARTDKTPAATEYKQNVWMLFSALEDENLHAQISLRLKLMQMPSDDDTQKIVYKTLKLLSTVVKDPDENIAIAKMLANSKFCNVRDLWCVLQYVQHDPKIVEQVVYDAIHIAERNIEKEIRAGFHNPQKIENLQRAILRIADTVEPINKHLAELIRKKFDNQAILYRDIKYFHRFQNSLSQQYVDSVSECEKIKLDLARANVYLENLVAAVDSMQASPLSRNVNYTKRVAADIKQKMDALLIKNQIEKIR